MQLYKILSLENWQKSQSQEILALSDDDKDFIHFSTRDQLERVRKKYWPEGSKYVVLEVDSKKLLGRLVLEANPGSANKYYHLYDGAIPLQAIVALEL
ncbi:MAG: hypothetical protein ChlgKO_00970 [Chlamydiales bacterium]